MVLSIKERTVATRAQIEKEYDMETRTSPIATTVRRPGRASLRGSDGLPGCPARVAGLVDIENVLVVRDRMLPALHWGEVFEALDPYLVGIPVRVACGPWVVNACMPELASRGWGRTLVPGEPDAADLALIEAGRQMAACGVTDLVIVSGDHAFATLAPVARLHVIARRGSLSRQLRLAATTITYLPALQNHTQAVA